MVLGSERNGNGADMSKSMSKSLLLPILVSLAASFLFSAPVHADARHLNVIEIQDSINPGVQELLEYAVEVSTEEKAECLIVLLDTPGGLMTSMRGIVEAFLSSPVPVVVYVFPPGAQAASAGVLITAAADIAAMAPGTNIGAAHPVMSGGEDVPKTMNEKVVNDMVALAQSIARQRGRNAEWLEDSIRESASITAEEAFEQNVIDFVADDLDTLADRLDGWQLHRKGQITELHTKGAELRTIEPGWRHNVLKAIANPNIAYILLLIGLAGIYFELANPGTFLPGITGALSLILAFYAMQTLPVNYAGFLFIVLAVVCFMLEIKVASYGLLSLAGVICLVLGSLMLFRIPGESMQLALSVFIPSIVVVSVFFAGMAALAFRSQTRKTLTGAEGLIGDTGRATTDINPEGKVFIEGELWNAEAEEPILSGEDVRVVSVENLKLKVKRIDVK